jgi:hypothetical protein
LLVILSRRKLAAKDLFNKQTRLFAAFGGSERHFAPLFRTLIPMAFILGGKLNHRPADHNKVECIHPAN